MSSDATNEAPPMVAAAGITKSYRMGKIELEVLREVDITVRQGEFVAVYGHSGSGKSTLLHILGLLDTPDAGRVRIEAEDTTAMSSRRRNRLRNAEIGFIFQFYQLLPELSVLENTCLPAMVGTPAVRWPGRKKHARENAERVLAEVGLADRLKHRPGELSGGERQRVAIARALLNGPKLLLADEPTGNLDSRTGAKILEMLKKCNREHGQTIIMVTHDRELIEPVDRTVTLRDGRLQQQQ